MFLHNQIHICEWGEHYIWYLKCIYVWYGIESKEGIVRLREWILKELYIHVFWGFIYFY